MRCYSLFCGIGGFDLALKNQGHTIVGACEIDKYARQTYRKNFGAEPSELDATKIKSGELPDFDLLCAGFPCQAFSLAGNRLGFEDTRGTLFFEIARIARQKRPKLLLLENVKGLLSDDRGKTFTVILSTLDELGYDIEWQVFDSKYFVPQGRERIFIIASLREESKQKIFPIREVPELCPNKEEPTSVRTLSGGAHSGGHHSQMTMILTSHTKANIKQRLQERENTWTLDTTDGYFALKDGAKFRRLTPLECERLQGFPDKWTEGVSTTQRYKQLGNAVTVPVVEYILERLK